MLIGLIQIIMKQTMSSINIGIHKKHDYSGCQMLTLS